MGRIERPEFGGPRLHIEVDRCPVCGQSAGYMKAWALARGGPFVIRHEDVEHIEARWPFDGRA
jgi:hypothetical protein